MPEIAIRTLLDGCQWQESIRICYKYNLSNMIESVIKPSIKSGISYLVLMD